MESLFFHENPFGRLAICVFQQEARPGMQRREPQQTGSQAHIVSLPN